jgi:hypothetical protein
VHADLGRYPKMNVTRQTDQNQWVTYKMGPMTLQGAHLRTPGHPSNCTVTDNR